MCAAGPRLKERREHVLGPRLLLVDKAITRYLQNGWIMRTNQNFNIKQMGYLEHVLGPCFLVDMGITCLLEEELIFSLTKYQVVRKIK